ncbi:hypothetical protein [Sphingobacterium paramultivorum]|uniref:hypothetical protein n=1 Tax=Sphingobacterium paramultivorum TaxID=2886510 RepID=UPI00129CB214|nr:hypothetical protein [Sphingobacterium paramultivorum]
MKENKNIILLLEDDNKIREAFSEHFKLSCKKGILIETRNIKEYLEVFEKEEQYIKCLIMDLNNKEASEEESINLTIEQITTQFNNNRIPIFVHSGNLERFTTLDEKGTIIKKEKSRKSVSEIVSSINLMLESGFLEIFSKNGSLDQKIMEEIHGAFISQFKHDEIEKIIKSIQSEPSEHLIERIRIVFERIAIRSIYHSFLNKNSLNNAFSSVNAIEHYLRRSNIEKYPFFTGDVLECSKKNLYFVATPRCNIANKNYDEILLCRINKISEDQRNGLTSTKIDNNKTGETKGKKQLRMSITDDVTNSHIGERFRFLPPSPQFEGGYVDFKQLITVPKEDLEKFGVVISLVDDFANDVVRKLTGYLLRGGIADTDYNEAMYYLKRDELLAVAAPIKSL